MVKKSIKGFVIIAVIVVLIAVGINKYIQSITTVEYGLLPKDPIPQVYEKVTYTIPTIDEEGHSNAQTFTVDNTELTKTMVKLAVRNDKVKKHEFVDNKDVPEHLKKKMPRTNF